MKNEITFSPSLMISFALALTVWAIFYPGILSADSLYTYDQAITGRFTDIRPPLLSFALFLFFRAGGTLSLFTLLECSLGFLGVRRLLLIVAGSSGTERRMQELIASIGMLILSSPLTPMPVYFATLWSDSWLAIFLLWTIALMLELHTEGARQPDKINYLKISMILFLIELVLLIRWNSLILYFPLILILSIVLSDKFISRRLILALSLAPLIMFLAFLLFQYWAVGVRRVHTERMTFAVDLASMIVYDPSVCQALSLKSCGLILGKISPEFMVGNGAIDHTMNQGLGFIEPAYGQLTLNSSLPQDLWLAATRYPDVYIKVKILNFLDYLYPQPRYFFQSFMHPNNYNLYLNTQFEAFRGQYITWLYTVYTCPILMLFGFAHITWIFLDLAGIIYCFAFNRKPGGCAFPALVLLVPLSYELSYLLTLPSSDFRYMYPATLLIQVIMIGLVITFPQSIRLGKVIL